MTPVKLHYISANIPDVCVKCLNEKGTQIHCLWECPKIQMFWGKVVKCLSLLGKSNIPLRAKICILGIHPGDFNRTRMPMEMIDVGLLLARRMIASCWKNVEPPSLEMWKRELRTGLGLEGLTYMVKGKQEEFVCIWDSFMSFLANECPKRKCYKGNMELLILPFYYINILIYF